jgi:hypothetical protein
MSDTQNQIEGQPQVGSDALVLDSPCACQNWARLFDGIHDKETNHHPNCPRVDDSLIDVWRVEYDGDHYFCDHEPDASEMHPEEVVTKERMHKELFDRLLEFTGF